MMNTVLRYLPSWVNIPFAKWAVSTTSVNESNAIIALQCSGVDLLKEHKTVDLVK